LTRNPDLIAAVERAREVGASHEPIEVRLVERVPLERRLAATVSRLAGTAVPAQAGGIDRAPAILVLIADLTEQDRVVQMRADFIANASHELRTPVASLRGFIETLQGPAREDAAARTRFLGIMAQQAERMTRLIDDLLSLSRIEMRAHLAPKGEVDLDEVVAHVAQALEPIARGAGISLRVDVPDEPATIRGERDEIVQMVQNLAQNAIKYGRSGGHVHMRVARDAATQRLELAVADDGPGIAPEHLPRLTERFYRVDVATSREKGGTGLGLAIVKHILTRHEATLRVTSRVGVGSTFTVSFEELKGKKAQ
jgi:two-component system phosphate regulon sensor histidine kinase PhoR